MDAANDLKGALARGELPCIGATTFSEYKRYILTDPALNGGLNLSHCQNHRLKKPN